VWRLKRANPGSTVRAREPVPSPARADAGQATSSVAAPWARATAALLVAVLLTSASCHVPGAVRPTVKIGLVAPFEGRYRYIGYDVIYAARLAVREVNASGGVAGYSIELVAYDDGAEVEAASLCARKLGIDAAVVGAIGHFVEGSTWGAASDYAKSGIALVAPAAYHSLSHRAPGQVYAFAPTAPALAGAILDRLEPLATSSVGLVAFETTLADALRGGAARRDFALEPDLSPTDPRIAEVVVSAAPDAMIIDAVPTVAAGVVLALRNAGWKGTIIGAHDLTATDFATIAGPAATAWCVTPWPLPVELQGGDDFAARYEQVSGGVPPGRLALPAYEATWILIEAVRANIERDGTPTREGVAQALARTRRTGLLGTITFGPDRQWEEPPLYACEIHPPPAD